MTRTIYSFDVFDTCITRPFVAPTDLFRELAKQALTHAGLRTDESSVERLQGLRIEAEREARRRHKNQQDVSLSQIYECLAELSDFVLDYHSIQSMEQELELEYCSPIADVLHMVNDRRTQGKVVYVSDMYLPAKLIQEMLEKCGFWQAEDTLYVSNVVGKTKHHGDMYSHVANIEGVDTCDIFHLGDNRHADLNMARKAGVKAQLFNAADLTRYERSTCDAFQEPAVRQFIGLNRAIRLAAGSSENHHLAPPASLLHSVIAPFLTVFVAWLLREAKRAGRERLYFVSRDAQIFLKIARILSAGDHYPECRYLYGSRKAWFAPSLQRCDKEEIRWAYQANMERTPAAILRRLDLDAEEHRAALSNGGFQDLSEKLDEQRTLALVALIESGELASAALAASKLTCVGVLAYLQQEGLMESDKWSLVDIGWVLNCQQALSRVLSKANPDVQVHGYYLGVNKKHVAENEGGHHTAYFAHSSAENPGAHAGDWIFSLPSMMLLEHLFTPATHGTVLGYSPNHETSPLRELQWQPTTKNIETNNDYAAWVTAFHSATEIHAAEIAKSGILEKSLDTLMPAANHILQSFLDRPDKEDVAAVSWLTSNIEQSHIEEHGRTLASPMKMRDLLEILYVELNPRRSRYANPNHAWLNGSATLSKPMVRELYFFTKRLKDMLRGQA